MLVAEIAAAVIIARPRGIRRTAGLLAPGFVRDFDFGFFALIGRCGIAVQFGVLLLGGGGHVLAFAHDVGRRIQGLVVGLEHYIGFECLADMRLQVERRQLQEPNGLLQLRRHGQLLADAKLQTWLQHVSFKVRPTV